MKWHTVHQRISSPPLGFEVLKNKKKTRYPYPYVKGPWKNLTPKNMKQLTLFQFFQNKKLPSCFWKSIELFSSFILEFILKTLENLIYVKILFSRLLYILLEMIFFGHQKLLNLEPNDPPPRSFLEKKIGRDDMRWYQKQKSHF